MKHLLGFLLFFNFAFANTSSAFAALGDDESKISENDEVALKAVSHRVAATSPNFKLHELDLNGTLVKECVGPSGKVIAVSWHGIKHPNLSVVFGPYFKAYQAERAKTGPVKGMRIVNVVTPQLVVTQGGHMRNLQGFAYVPALVPQDFDLGNCH